MTQTLITRAGLARLREELEHLTTTGRQEIAERIKAYVSAKTSVTDSEQDTDAESEPGTSAGDPQQGTPL